MLISQIESRSTHEKSLLLSVESEQAACLAPSEVKRGQIADSHWWNDFQAFSIANTH